MKNINLSKVAAMLKVEVLGAEKAIEMSSDKVGFGEADVKELESNLLQVLEVLKDRDTSAYKQSGVSRTIDRIDSKDEVDSRSMSQRLNDITATSNTILNLIKSSK